MSNFMKYLLCCLLAVSLVIPFEKFTLIDAAQAMIISIIISFILFIGVNIVKSVCAKMIVENKAVVWFQKHKANFVLLCIMLVSLSSSLKNTIIYDESELKGFLSLQWTIFTITITIFIVWTAIMVKYLKDSEPNIDDISGNDPDEISLFYKIRKKKFYAEIVQRTSSLIFVILSAIVLIICTAIAYVVQEGVTIFSQTLAIFSFYMTVNSLSQILIEITIPYFNETIELLINNDVSAKDINESQNKVLLKVVRTKLEKKVNSDNSLTDEEKRDKINKTYEKIKQMVEDLNKDESVNKDGK